MSRVYKFSLFVILSLLLSFTAAHAATYHYATTDMTFAEFYAGETQESSSDLYAQGLDAISTPTTHGLARFPLVLGVSGDTGTTISGLKAVQVRMTDDVYAALSSDSRFTFTTSEFDEYKPVNSDGTFGAMVTETTTAADAVAVIASGSSARWGHYVISVQSADITIGSANKYCDYYLGALIETAYCKIYGLRHDNNIWSNTDIAFCVSANYTEPHGTGVKRYYEYTADLQGETITKITYMLKDRPDVVINTNLYVKKQTSATVQAVSPELDTGAKVQVQLALTNADGYTFSGVALRSGRTSIPVTDYTYSDGVLTLTNPAAGSYTVTFTSDEYVDISATFTLSDHYATTNMTWAEFYAGETAAKSSGELLAAGMDAVSSPTARVAGRFTQLASESNDLGGRDITGVKNVQVRMVDDVYQRFSNDVRYTFVDTEFAEYKDVNAVGMFGRMVTEYEEADNAAVTLKSGANSTWGNYMLSISGVNIVVASGDERFDLGALITTSDGKVYGLRHNSNLWFSAGEIALTYKDFIEPHGIARDYDYTSDLQGKTITKIQFMLKNQPDVVIDCSVYLKLESPASVSYAYPEGYNGILAGTGDPIAITFSGLPSGVTYDIDSVTPSIRHAAALDSELYEYSNGELTFAQTVGAGKYKAVFSTERYSDLAATVEVFTTDATSLIISADKNAAELNFLLTPKGYIDAVDAVLNTNKFVNASDYTTLAENSTSNYTAANNIIFGSGFTFDIVLNGVSSDYTGIVGFGKIVTMTSSTLGSLYDSVYTAVNAIPIGASGWREIPKFSALNSTGLKVVQVLPDGTSRDISSLTGTGAMIDSDGAIMFFYGVMAADSSTITEGEYTLSPEGETLINDGLRDGHISTTIYIEGTQSGSSTPSTPDTPDIPSTPDTPDEGDSYSATPGTPAVNVQDSATAQKILNALSSGSGAVTSSTTVTSLPAGAAGKQRGLASVSEKELSAIPSGEEIALILPLMSVDREAVYVFGVDVDSLNAGAYIFLHMTAESKTANSAAFSASAEETAYTLLDDNGSEIQKVPANKHINIAAYMRPNYTYAPIITTKSSSSETPANPGGPGGGCDSGFSFTVLALFGGLGLLAKKHLVK